MPNNYYEKLNNTAIPTNTAENENSQAQPLPIQDRQIEEESTQENLTSSASFPDNSSGRLTVSVSTANQLSPVVGATVTVSSQDGENSTVLETSTTDRSGKSITFTLPAPNSSTSQEPTVLSPFAVYQVSVSHPDFYDFVAENVQVFGGIVTQLPVNLIPLPELSNGETTKIVIIPKQNL